jgi:hypothetical protein
MLDEEHKLAFSLKSKPPNETSTAKEFRAKENAVRHRMHVSTFRKDQRDGLALRLIQRLFSVKALGEGEPNRRHVNRPKEEHSLNASSRAEGNLLS